MVIQSTLSQPQIPIDGMHVLLIMTIIITLVILKKTHMPKARPDEYGLGNGRAPGPQAME